MTKMAFKKIKFVTDSTADIPEELLGKHDIRIVPVFVNYNNTSYADDGKELNRAEYYQHLADLRPFPTTSAMPSSLTEKAVMEAMQDADHVIILTVSSKLSGVHNAFRLGAQKLPSDKYTLIDSQSVTSGLGIQVIVGAETAAQTGDVAKTIDAINRVREASRVYAAVGTLEFLHRSGRVGWAAAGIGSLLQIKPLLKVEDGEVKQMAKVRTFSRAVDELVRVAREHAPLDRLVILYTVDQEGAHQLRERLNDIAPSDHTYIVQICSAVGTHLGPNGLGVVPVGASWKK
jgi:DegV family protein with EDD domain